MSTFSNIINYFQISISNFIKILKSDNLKSISYLFLNILVIELLKDEPVCWSFYYYGIIMINLKILIIKNKETNIQKMKIERNNVFLSIKSNSYLELYLHYHYHL